MEASPPRKIEWALACDQITVTEDGAIEQLGRPFKRTFVSAPFPVDGINLELPVIIMFSDVAEEGIRDFIFTYRVFNSVGEHVGGGRTRVVFHFDVPDDWPTEWAMPNPMPFAVRFLASAPGAYGIEFSVNGSEEKARLGHLLAVE